MHVIHVPNDELMKEKISHDSHYQIMGYEVCDEILEMTFDLRPHLMCYLDFFTHKLPLHHFHINK
jgi:hypothetical protein